MCQPPGHLVRLSPCAWAGDSPGHPLPWSGPGCLEGRVGHKEFGEHWESQLSQGWVSFGFCAFSRFCADCLEDSRNATHHPCSNSAPTDSAELWRENLIILSPRFFVRGSGAVYSSRRGSSLGPSPHLLPTQPFSLIGDLSTGSSRAGAKIIDFGFHILGPLPSRYILTVF